MAAKKLVDLIGRSYVEKRLEEMKKQRDTLNSGIADLNRYLGNGPTARRKSQRKSKGRPMHKGRTAPTSSIASGVRRIIARSEGPLQPAVIHRRLRQAGDRPGQTTVSVALDAAKKQGLVKRTRDGWVKM